jgi:hypothetical protein
MADSAMTLKTAHSQSLALFVMSMSALSCERTTRKEGEEVRASQRLYAVPTTIRATRGAYRVHRDRVVRHGRRWKSLGRAETAKEAAEDAKK